MAAQHAHGDVAAELLERGATTDAKTGRGFTALMLACLYDQIELVTNLLERGKPLIETSIYTNIYSLPSTVWDLLSRSYQYNLFFVDLMA